MDEMSRFVLVFVWWERLTEERQSKERGEQVLIEDGWRMAELLLLLVVVV